jgi:hypothetical protein
MTQRFVLAATAVICILPFHTTCASATDIDRLLSAAFEETEPGAVLVQREPETGGFRLRT